MSKNAFEQEVKISWEAPEIEHHERGLVWKITMSIIVLSIIVLGLFYNNWTFSLLIFVFALTYYLSNFKKPEILIVKISNIGIKVGTRNYPYSRIEKFWIIYEPPFISTLNISIQGELLNQITIQLNEQDPSEIREFLSKKIKEDKGKIISLTDIILKLLKI